MMITKKQLKSAEHKVYVALDSLNSALGMLSNLASEIFGEELIADLCSGVEIEFRHPEDELGEVIRIEDLISKINERKDK